MEGNVTYHFIYNIVLISLCYCLRICYLPSFDLYVLQRATIDLIWNIGNLLVVGDIINYF